MRGTDPPSDAPLSVIEIACRSAEALTASGAATWALKAGMPAPDFNLYDADGRAVSLRDALAHGPVIVTFHGGLWCPTSTRELRALEAARPEFSRHGATLLVLTPQTSCNNRTLWEKIEGGFPLLADPRNRVADAYGVLVKLPAALICMYKRSGINLPALNGDESWTLPLPARFVIAPDHTIHYAEVSPDFTRRSDPLDLLPVLRRASRSA